MLRCGLCPAISSVFVSAVTALLVWCGVFVTGLRHCGVVVMVCVGRNGGGAVVRVVLGVCLPASILILILVLFLSSSPVCGVRGSARAALRARTLSPNTIVFSLLLVHPLFLPLLAFLRAPPFCYLNGGE